MRVKEMDLIDRVNLNSSRVYYQAYKRRKEAELYMMVDQLNRPEEVKEENVPMSKQDNLKVECFGFCLIMLNIIMTMFAAWIYYSNMGV